MSRISFILLTAIVAAPLIVQAAAADGVSFLRSRQDGVGLVDGSVRSTDWAVIGVSAAGTDPSSIGSPSLVAAIESHPIDASATSLERRILALRAAGRSAANEASQLLGLANGGQLGDPSLLNDDDFGVLALTAAGVGATVIGQSVQFIQANQNPDGGFSSLVGGRSDVDSTGAALAALAAGHGGSDAIDRAVAYLAAQQSSDGGFGVKLGSGSNVDSTSWALWSYHTAGRANMTAEAWLRSAQQPDGSFGGAVETAYALIAFSGRALPIIGSFPVPPSTNPTEPGTTPSRSVSTSVSISVSSVEPAPVNAAASTGGADRAPQPPLAVDRAAVSASGSATNLSVAPVPRASEKQTTAGPTAVDATAGQVPPATTTVAAAAPVAVADRPIDQSAPRLVQRLLMALVLVGSLDLALIAVGFGRWLARRHQAVVSV